MVDQIKDTFMDAIHPVRPTRLEAQVMHHDEIPLHSVRERFVRAWEKKNGKPFSAENVKAVTPEGVTPEDFAQQTYDDHLKAHLPGYVQA